jgi:hypothetical protein
MWKSVAFILLLSPHLISVQAIFKRCGAIVSSKRVTSANAETESIQIKYKTQAEADKAISTFHGQPADGRILQVVQLSGGVSLKNEAGGVVSVDALLGDETDSFGCVIAFKLLETCAHYPPARCAQMQLLLPTPELRY